ncbi:MAG: hypothetical protein HND56_02040 [Pseudomonadota bacterium]|nr:hypothetical protein [Pseudomonadota bacterium]QKK04542.1 MAG: hypothetical protein HND56_02040 [Pseudomonadota bacterium]
MSGSNNHPVRGAVGKVFRSKAGSLAATLSLALPAMVLTYPLMLPVPDDDRGENYEDSAAYFDAAFQTLEEQKQTLDAANKELSFANQNDSDTYQNMLAKHNTLQKSFHAGTQKFIKEVHFDGNLSEEDVLDYMDDLEDDIIDPEVIGYQGFEAGMQNETDAYAVLRECRAKSNGDLDKLQSLMAEESADLNENSIYLGLVFGLLLNIFGFDKRLRKGAESEGFRNWEKGRSKTPFSPPTPKH